MLPTMLSLVLILLAIYLWQNALRARELARVLSHRICAQAGVQLLDQTVAVQRMRVRRIPGLGLRMWRRYGFELSTDGHDRHFGSLDLLDGEMDAYSLPLTGERSSLSTPLSNVLQLPVKRLGETHQTSEPETPPSLH